MYRYLYVSHGRSGGGNTRTDLDAIASVALFWRGALRRDLVRGEDFEVDFIDYYENGLDGLLRHHDVTAFVADVPPEAIARPADPVSIERLLATLQRLRERSVSVNFVDHHPLSSMTSKLFHGFVREGLMETAILSEMDADADQERPIAEKFCAAEMSLAVIRDRLLMPPDEEMLRIARFARDQDFGIRAIAEANRLSTVIGADHDPIAMAELLAHGRFWSDELEAIRRFQEQRIRRSISALRFDRREWRLKSGRTIPVIYALLPPDDSLRVTVAGIHCLEEQGARVAVIVHRHPFISIRMDLDEKELHAGRMLTPLGGGGHRGAASAGGRGGSFPYREANESNFRDVVSRIDDHLRSATPEAFG